MKTQQPATVERLNAIQAEWMKLDCGAPDAEKRRVFALMDELPSCYANVSADELRGQPIVQGMPVWAEARGLGYVVDYLRRLNLPGVRVDVAWQGSKWIPMPEIKPVGTGVGPWPRYGWSGGF